MNDSDSTIVAGEYEPLRGTTSPGSLERQFRDLLATDQARYQLLVNAALAALSAVVETELPGPDPASQ